MAFQVDYYFAPASPWAYLGHSRFEHLVKAFDIDVSVRPFDLVQQVFPVSGGGGQRLAQMRERGVCVDHAVRKAHVIRERRPAMLEFRKYPKPTGS